ncbi:MAG: 1-(5-phosphoribosyl)-5-[(5-phosphoribosylamino)methylideneamino]imidazole-4-carboxamide isomerase [Gemmataceae bacterium]
MFVYPAIDLRGGRAVRLRQGDYSQETIFHDDPTQAAKAFVSQGADRLHLVDLDGAKAGKPVNGDVIRRIVESVPVPCQLGGGIRNDADVETVFSWGVQWAVLGSRAVRDPQWARTMAHAHPERIVLGVDARNGLVATDGWLETSTISAVSLVVDLESAPFFAVVYTDIAKDGMMAGPNFDALAELQNATRLPVIASGGVSSYDDVRKLAAAKSFGCIVGRALYEGAVELKTVLELSR